MPTPDDRVAALIAGALAGELTAAEQAELDQRRSEQPWIDEELRELGALSDRLRHGDLAWTASGDTTALRARTLAALADEHQPQPATITNPSDQPTLSRPRRWVTPLVAAACLMVGIGLGVGVPGLLDRTPSGPPGTLGAVEPVAVSVAAPGVALHVDVVAHTWGTEAILTATGLTVGSPYEVIFIGADGEEFSAGQVLGSQVPIVCRMNAAVLRPDTVRIEVRSAQAQVVAHAELPPA